MSRRTKRIRQNTSQNAPLKAAKRKENTRQMARVTTGRLTPAEHRLNKKAAAKLAKANIVAINPQPKTKSRYQIVNIDDLKIDNSYQRPIKEKHIADIIMYFTWEGFGTPVVGRRKNGSLWLIDGQQRIIAAQRLGVTSVEAEIVESRGPKHEASLFHLLNSTSVVPTKMQIFRAALRAGNNNAVVLNKAVKAAGFEIHLDHSNLPYGNEWPCIRALSRLEKLYKFGGSAFVTEVLTLIGELWTGESDACREDIIGGMHRFIRFTRYNDPRPKDWLYAYMPSRGLTRRERIKEVIKLKGLTAEGLHNKAANSKESASGYSRAEAVQRILDKACSFNSRRATPKSSVEDEV